MALGLPRRLAPVLPTTYSPRSLPLAKAYVRHKHEGFPYHAFAHCKVRLTAAPRRARTSISVSFSGQPLSWPLRIFGLVVHYTANSLIRRRPILRRRNFRETNIPVSFSIGYYTQFPKVIPDRRAGYRRVTEQYASALASPMTCMSNRNPPSSTLLQDKQETLLFGHKTETCILILWKLTVCIMRHTRMGQS